MIAVYNGLISFIEAAEYYREDQGWLPPRQTAGGGA
jgi:hypothetical protein